MGLTADQVQQIRQGTVIIHALVNLAGFCDHNLGSFMHAIARLQKGI